MTEPTSPGRRDLGAYALVVAAWLATRAFAVVSVDMTPWNLNDLRVYASWLPWFHIGHFPSSDPMWQYPPGAAGIFVAADSLPLSFRWGFTFVMLALDAALMAALLVAHARRPDASWRGPLLWSAAGLVVGSILLARFDVAPTLFAVLAVLFAMAPVRSSRSLLSGAAAAIGMLVKVWPALMLLTLPRRALTRGVAAWAAVTLVVLGAASLWSTGSLSFLHNQEARGLQLESVGALPYVLTRFLEGEHLPTGLRYGSIQILLPGTETVGLAITGVGILVFAIVAWLRLAGRLEDVPAGDIGLALVLVSVATSRVYSPQFNTWLVGLAAAALLARSSRMLGPAVLVVVVSLITQVVYPWRMSQLIEGDGLSTWLQTARIAGLVAATVWALVAIRPRRSDPDVATTLSR